MSRKHPIHPIQPIEIDERGVARFKANAIVRYILDTKLAEITHPGAPVVNPRTGEGYHKGMLDLNKLAGMDFPREDWEQFAQLMGYSISGFGDLSYASDAVYLKATKDYQRALKRRAKRPRRSRKPEDHV